MNAAIRTALLAAVTVLTLNAATAEAREPATEPVLYEVVGIYEDVDFFGDGETTYSSRTLFVGDRDEVSVFAYAMSIRAYEYIWTVWGVIVEPTYFFMPYEIGYEVVPHEVVPHTDFRDFRR